MPSSGRLSHAIAAITLLGGAGGLFWMGATAAAIHIERETMAQMQQVLQQGGHDWARVRTDGLQVQLSGTAPSEVERFRLISQAGMAFQPDRILDLTTDIPADAQTPPDFQLELLRNGEGISLIGLVPAQTDRPALLRQLRSETAAPGITDLLEAADYPVPEGWNAAIATGLKAVQLAPRSKVSVTPGHVRVAALADSAQDKARLERELRHNLPAGLELETEISSPRPVIAPFALHFAIDDSGARMDSCSAGTETGRDRIIEAAIRAGIADAPSCNLGLGAPTPDWSHGVVPAIEAVAELGRGAVSISDADITLTVPAEIGQERLDQVTAALTQALPPVFSLHIQKVQPDQGDPTAAEFTATSTSDGIVTLQGGMSDQRMLEAVDSFAQSRFTAIDADLRSDAAVPAGWTVQIITGLEALNLLDSGTVTVSPANLRLTGVSGDAGAVDLIADALAQRLGAGKPYELAIRYDRQLDQTLGLPDGEECVARMNIAMTESEIGFEPNRSTIAGDPGQTLSQLAAIMTDCAEFQIEAGGHTDSQGSAGFNADLSRARAQTLVTAMQEAGIDTSHMTSHGYGESQPIADNATPEGREANRRIEFRLLSPIPVRAHALPAPVIRKGVTGGPQPDPQPDLQPDPSASPDLSPAWQAAPDTGLVPDAPFGPVLPQPLITPGAQAAADTAMLLHMIDDNIPRPSPRPQESDMAADGADSP